MIIEITGKQGSGKTGLNTLFMTRELTYGEMLRRRSIKIINDQNAHRFSKLAYPYKPPISANYEAHIRTGYNEVFEPYWLNPYRLGLPTPQTADKIQQVFPYSCLHITEGRKYWDARESLTMPDNVIRWFETHRHNYLTIIIDTQRGKALDLHIRENCNRFIEVQGMRNDKDAYGRIIRSTWYCREFYSLQDYEAYLSGSGRNYRATTYHYEGNIFECYESRNRKDDFVPAEGKQYSMLEQVSADALKRLPKKVAELYDTSRPDWYRKKSEPTKENQKNAA